jgi:serine/threonine-protein kinase HipA
MPRHLTHAPLAVYINSKAVGRLRRAPSGAVDFQYRDEWLNWEHAFPISLSLPLRADRYIGASVLAVLENLLPDNEAILRRVSERVHAQGTDAYSLLTAIGRDCVGALQFLPEGSDPGPAGGIDAHPLSDEDIADLLRNLTRIPLGLTSDDEFRISIAGAQEKTALLHWNGKWCRPQGATATSHIFKRPIGRVSDSIDLSESVENEYLCLLLTEAFSLPTAKAKIGLFDEQKALIIERFDRLWTKDGRLLRVPQEDCCQALSIPPSKKYEADKGPGIPAILHLLNGSDEPMLDQRTFLRANIVFWLLGAIDGHAKNFSLRISEGGRYRLTPLYDVVSAQFAVDSGRIRQNGFKLAMAVGKNRHYVVDKIAPRHFLQTATVAGIGESVVQSIFDGLQDGMKAVDKVMNELPRGFPEHVRDPIYRGIQKRMRLFELM